MSNYFFISFLAFFLLKLAEPFREQKTCIISLLSTVQIWVPKVLFYSNAWFLWIRIRDGKMWRIRILPKHAHWMQVTLRTFIYFRAINLLSSKQSCSRYTVLNILVLIVAVRWERMHSLQQSISRLSQIELNIFVLQLQGVPRNMTVDE